MIKPAVYLSIVGFWIVTFLVVGSLLTISNATGAAFCLAFVATFIGGVGSCFAVCIYGSK